MSLQYFLAPESFTFTKRKGLIINIHFAPACLPSLTNESLNLNYRVIDLIMPRWNSFAHTLRAH